jgi:hypothetical protein
MYTYRLSQIDLLGPEDEIFICHWDIQNSISLRYQEVLDFIVDPDTLWEFEEIKTLDQLHELIKHFREFIKDVRREWSS